ncbi:MAG: hypothetical protein C4297_01810 [Gemmataceae bacterium]
MNDQAVKFRLGIFVLGASLLLAILIILFGEFPALFTRPYRYTIRFPQAPGVEAGTPVRKSGVRIGEVTNVELDPDTGDVIVQITVARKYQLRQGDLPVIGRGLVLGDASINFFPEGEDRRPAPDGFVFQGKPPTDIRQALGRATDLAQVTQDALEEIRSAAKGISDNMPVFRRTAEELQVAARNFGRVAERAEVLIETNQDKFTKTLDQVSELASRANDVLTEDNRKNLAALLRNMRDASDQLSQLARNADATLTDIRQSAKDFDAKLDSLSREATEGLREARATLKRLSDSLARADEVLTNVQQITRPLADQAPMLAKNLEQGLARFNQITMNLQDFSKALAEGDGTVRRLVSDPSLYNNVNDTVVGLQRAVSRFDRIIRDLELFADKIARHPELLGVGGVVSPSSGIKR